MWYNRFKEGREDVNDDSRSGRSSTLTSGENVKAVKKMILDNRRITFREVAHCSAHVTPIFTDVLGMKREAAKIAAKFLNLEQKLSLMNSFKICSTAIDRSKR